ncbi:MAG: RelA/SpoT domain-containing protein [Actinobacteria bacterium]|nr:RelA/SpoT domain-containing protein [Actinomycetota bacterium]
MPLKRYRTHECVLPSTKVLDELGEAIRTSTMTPSDWAMFDELSRDWWRALNSIETEIKNLFSGSDFNIASRMKNFGTLREKLRRTTLKLSEVRDIIGCRVVVLNQNEDQDLVVRRITESIQTEKFKIIDRRINSNHGYRAVHIELRIDRIRLEIQVRTQLQDLWASTSEAFGELVGRGVRYGKEIELERFSARERILILQIETGLASASNKIGVALAKNYEQDSTEIREIHSELGVINSLIANTDWGLQS